VDEFGHRLGVALLIAINLIGVGLIVLTALALWRVW